MKAYVVNTYGKDAISIPEDRSIPEPQSNELLSFGCFIDNEMVNLSLLDDFSAGRYQVQPKKGYNAFGEYHPRYTFQDNLLHKLLYRIIKPTFKHVISLACHHLKGPSAIKLITYQLHDTLSSEQYRYAIRTDIKSYCASIYASLPLLLWAATTPGPVATL